MRHALSNEPWKSLLPDSYDWLEKVSLSGASPLVAGAHYVVAVKAHETDKDQLVLNAPKLPQETAHQILEQVKALGWRLGAGSLTLAVGGQAFTLVPQSTTKVTASQSARQLGLDAAKATKELRPQHLALAAAEGMPALEVFDGYASGLYAPIGFKGQRKKDAARFPAKVSLAGSDVTPKDAAQALAFARSQSFTRFLQDAPANYMNPVKFGEIAKDLARENGLTHKILDKEQMQQLGMGSFLSVADGSLVEPRLVVIEIEGQDKSKTVGLVGKGVTFDSGGISIKPAAGMDEMKYDMSGGAAVLGAAHFFTQVKPPVNVVCLVGATENMPSSNATRPGDIVRAMNGKTIEVLNTDAEGRLVLADVLAYAVSQYKLEMVVDIATLTGAVLMALGCVGEAVMTNDQATAQRVIQAAEGRGEPAWQLPLWAEFEKEVKSEIADLKNIAKANVKAGTIIGGIFLKEFVGDTKWAHLDVAGTAWNCQAVGYPTAGGAAFGLRTMVGTCMSFGQ